MGNIIGMWIRLDHSDAVQVKFESATEARVSVRDWEKGDNVAIPKALKLRFGGVWMISGDWERAEAENEVVAFFRRTVK